MNFKALFSIPLFKWKKLTKLLLIMKLSAVLIVVGCLQVSARTYSQNVTLSSENVPLQVVFREIEKQTGFHFFYRVSLASQFRNVDVHLDNTPLKDAMDEVLKGQPLKYKVINKTIVITQKTGDRREYELVAPDEDALAVNVSGIVTDPQGTPLARASVKIKNTNRGVSTNDRGSYSLSNVAENAVLVISYVGFRDQEVMVQGRSVINIVMEKESVGMKEVVAIGYGDQSRRFLTSSIASVSQEELNKAPTTDIGMLLQGKVAGLNITKNGDPLVGSSIILRGASTLRGGAQSPLFVVDGVPGASTAVVPPDEIESIDVLKDAVATAIYGSRAANGVIIITTKKAKAGQPVISYNGYAGFEKRSNGYDMMNADQLHDFLARNNQVLDPKDDLGANTNWQDEVMRTGFSHNHNISLSNNIGNNLTYNASFNRFEEKGILLKSNVQKTIARISLQQKLLNNRLELGVTAANQVSKSSNVPFRNIVLSQMLTYLPTVPVRNVDGSYYENFSRGGYFNPVSIIDNATEEAKSSVFLGVFTAKAKLPFGFTYNLSYSYQGSNYMSGSYYNKYYTEHYRDIRIVPEPGNSTGNYHFLSGENGVGSRGTSKNNSQLLETYLDWNRKFNAHEINVVLGYSYQKNTSESLSGTTTNFPSDEVSYYNLGMGDPYAMPTYRIGIGSYYTPALLISDFARLNYNYKGRYLLQASLRHDGSSVFGKDHQWGWFPAAGVAWRVINEPFMKNQSLLSDLKLRLGYGVTGNSLGIGPYSSKMLFGPVGSFYYNGQSEKAYGAIQNPNPDLHWERTFTSNIGLDFAVWNGRFEGSLDYYEKNTKDIIYGYTVDPSLYPVSSMTANVGEMSNKGIELVLSGTPIQRTDFKWHTSFNISHNRNKVVSLSNELFQKDNVLMTEAVGNGQSGVTIQILKAGMPIGQFYTFKYAGKNEEGVSQYYDHEGNVTADMSKLKAIEDYYYCGNAQPKALLGWSNMFKYKNFDLNIFLRSVLGAKVFNVTWANLNAPNSARLQNIPVQLASASTGDYNSSRYSDRWIEDASYLRFDNATLGYTLPYISSSIKRLRIYVTGNNLFVITPYKGIDPEINQGGLAPGVDANNFYPKTRVVMFGINASF